MSRTRTRGGLTYSPQVTWKHRYSNCSHANWTTYATSNGMKIGEVTTMIDEVIVDYHKRMKRGEVFFNPMYRMRKSYALLPGSGWALQGINNSCSNPVYKQEVEQSDTMSWICGPHGAEPPVSSLFTAADIQSLRTEVSTSVMNKRGRTDANLWETLAEAHKASRLIPQMARKAADFVTFGVNRAIREGKTLSRHDARFSDPAGLWLQFRYGLTPIMKDIENVLKNVHNERRIVRKTTRAMLTDHRVGAQKATYGPVDGGVKVDYVGNYDHQVRVRGMSLDEYSIGAIEEIGFTTKGLLTLPWELVPYSFVVDWFLNVGDYFGSLVGAFGYDHKGGALVVESIKSSTYLPTATYMQSGASYIVTRAVSGGVVAVHDEKYRTSLAAPGIVIRNDFRFDNFTRAADALALAGQRMEKAFKKLPTLPRSR